MVEIAASLWSVPPEERPSLLDSLCTAGLRRLHWDRSDGLFAAPGGFTAVDAAGLSAGRGLVSEAHLMMIDAAAEVDPWTDFCEIVYVHVESADWLRAVDRIERRGAMAGVAVSPGTPVSAIPESLAALCMSIVPGEAGSVFDPASLHRIAALRDIAPARRLGVDGGVTRAHAEALAAAGVDVAVVGTDLISAGGIERWRDFLQRE